MSNRPGNVPKVSFPMSMSGSGSISGTAGTWVNVTPSAMNIGVLNGDDYGVQDVLRDPVSPNVFYAFVCYRGVWKSTDYGLTWVKVSTTAALDGGKLWCAAIAPDASYMLTAIGNNFSGTPEARRQVWKSTDGGVTWTGNGVDLGVDPYCIRISPYDKTRVTLTNHDDAKFHESVDSGATWTQMLASVGSLGASNYCFYLDTSDRVLFVPQSGGTVGCYLLTKSGGTWSASAIADLSTTSHEHGFCEPLHDAANGAFYFGSADNLGIWRSTNNGTNWTQVGLSGQPSGVFEMTRSNLYAARGFPTQTTTGTDPKLSITARTTGTSWPAPGTAPAAMGNGPKRMATSTDGARDVVVAGCWCVGILRYIE